MITAKIISERSAGGLWIEVYVTREGADILVYSHDYFATGATEIQYRDRMEEAKIDAESCLTWGDWEGCDRDDEGNVVRPSDCDTAFVIAEFSQVNETAPGAWEVMCTEEGQRFVRDFLERIN